MTEIEQLEDLIEQDPEFALLHAGASKNTDSVYEHTPKELLALKAIYFPLEDIKTFFAKYKVMLAWSSLMGRVLNKIHGNSYDDYLAAKQISGTDYIYIIYSNKTKWEVLTAMDISKDQKDSTVELPINLAVRLDPSSNWTAHAGDIYLAEIVFSLVDYDTFEDLNTNKIYPNLLDSKMDIAIYQVVNRKVMSWTLPTRKKLFNWRLPVKEFSPDKLAEIIKDAYNL